MSKKITVGKLNYEKETYWCNKCKKFHRYLARGKPSITHKEHFIYISRYKHDFSQTELFKLSFKGTWKREANKASKPTHRGRGINE